jgi:hypothetical protein
VRITVDIESSLPDEAKIEAARTVDASATSCRKVCGSC